MLGFVAKGVQELAWMLPCIAREGWARLDVALSYTRGFCLLANFLPFDASPPVMDPAATTMTQTAHITPKIVMTMTLHLRVDQTVITGPCHLSFKHWRLAWKQLVTILIPRLSLVYSSLMPCKQKSPWCRFLSGLCLNKGERLTCFLNHCGVINLLCMFFALGMQTLTFYFIIKIQVFLKLYVE